MKDYYKILKIPRFSSIELVKSSYKDLVKIYHPDKNKGAEFSHEYMKLINEAYSVLGDIQNKFKYDEILKSHPDLLEQNEVIVFPQSRTMKFGNKLKSNKKNVLIVILIFGILITFLIFAFLIYSNNKINNELKNERIEKDKIHNEINRIREEQIKENTVLESNYQNEINKLKSESKKVEKNQEMNSQRESSNKITSKKNNPCKNITIKTSLRTIYITNQNSKELQTVELLIHPKWWESVPGEYVPIEPYEERCSNVKPGLNLFKAYHNISSIEILRCLDWNGNYSRP